MAVALLERVYATNFCRFAIDTSEDLSKLPTMTSKGREALSTVPSCSMGSLAIGTNGEDFILNGANEWVSYAGSFGGSNGGGSSSGNGSGGNASGSDGFIEL